MANNIMRGGDFLISAPSAQGIFSLEDLNQEQQMIRDTAKSFIEKEVMPYKSRFEHRDYALTQSLMNSLGEMGLLGVSVPEIYQGMAMGFVTNMLVCDAISGATGSLATAYGAHTGIGILPILYYGTEAQKQKYLPDLVLGHKFGAYCLTEPNAGSDANSGKTKARLSDDGQYYILNGQKMWITNAGFAQTFVVFAKIDDDPNITGFIVERDENNGMSFGEEEHKLGIRASSTRQVFFNDTKVPIENLLGQRNEGFKIALNALNVGRVKLAAACLDAQRNILKNSLNYALQRQQFGQNIANFGAIRKKIAQMALSIFVSEAATYRTGHQIEQKTHELEKEGLSHEKAELKAVEEFAIEASILKVYVSDITQDVADEGIQIFGGMGFSEDSPMEAAWRDSRISRIYEGTNEINRLLSIGMLIKRSMKGSIDLMSPTLAIKDELMSLPSFETPDFNAFMSQEKSLMANMKKIFLMVSGAALQKHGFGIEKEQLLLLEASEILNQIYMTESAILRAEKHYTENTLQAHMAQLQLYQAIEKINSSAKTAILSIASGDEQRLMLSALRRWSKYHINPNPLDLTELIAKEMIGS